MKKLVLLLLLLISSANIFAQDKKSLEERAKQMYEYTALQQYEKLIDLTYPKVFTLIPKEKMVEAMQRMSKGDGFTISIANTPPNFVFGAIKKIDGGSYSVISYDMNMKMAFTEPVSEEELPTLLSTFRSALKTENITFDKKDNSFTIIKKAQAVGVWDKDTNGKWTFVNNSDGPIKMRLFSDKVIRELGI